MTRSQATQTTGQWWEMVKALGDRLPKEHVPVGYHQEPRWFNQLVADLVKLEKDSEAARQIRWILTNGPFAGVLNPFAKEKVEPRFFYPDGYKPNSVGKQVETLLARLPWLDVSSVDALAKAWGTYGQADGLYVIPKPTALAGRLGLEDHWTNFGLLTEQGPLAALAASRTFRNYRVGEMGPDRYLLAESARAALELLEAEQPGDVLVFPAQTGTLFAGFSVRGARWDIEHTVVPSRQWPHPAYCVGWELYTNPHRLSEYKHLVVDCPGDEYRFEGAGEFTHALFFSIDDDNALYCNDRWINNPDDNCGSASGFLR